MFTCLLALIDDAMRDSSGCLLDLFPTASIWHCCHYSIVDLVKIVRKLVEVSRDGCKLMPMPIIVVSYCDEVSGRPGRTRTYIVALLVGPIRANLNRARCFNSQTGYRDDPYCLQTRYHEHDLLLIHDSSINHFAVSRILFPQWPSSWPFKEDAPSV